MPSAIVTLPDGQRAKVTFDNPEQLDKTVSDLVESHPVKFGHADPRTGHVRGVNDVIGEAVGEPAAKAITGIAGTAVGGVAGLARGAGAGIASLAMGEGAERARQAFTNEAVDTMGRVESAVTYQPRSKIGKAATQVVEYPFQLLAKGADIAGQKTAEFTGSPAAGAAVNTVIQAAPGAVLKALGRRPGVAGEGAPPRPPPNMSASGGARTPPSEVGAPGSQTPPQPPTAPPDMTATGAPRAPASDVGGGPVPRGTAPEAPGAASPQPAPSTPEGRAQAYARTLGLDWARLGAGTKKALTTIAQDATALDRLNPEAVKRQAHLQSLRVPVQATRGQLERDPVQLRREAIASNTTEGQPIRDVDIAANRDLQANLEVLRGRVGGKRGSLEEGVTEEGTPNPASIRQPTKTQTQVGETAQGAAREKAKWSKKGYQALYKIARETEPTAEASLKPVTDLLQENPDIQHLGWVQSWLAKAAKVKSGAGAPGETFYRRGSERGKNGLTFYSPDKNYVANFGDGPVREVRLTPRKTLDLTQFDARSDVPAEEIAQAMREQGIDIQAGDLYRGAGEPLQHLSQNRNPASLAAKISAAGFDSVRINEYVEGSGESQTIAMLGEHSAPASGGVGAGAEIAPLEKVTLNELDDLRKLAGKHGQGTDAHFASELRKAVDTAMEDVPEGATAWKRARDAFRRHQEEFKDQSIVSRLVNQKKGGADRALALEKTWKSVATGPLEQIRQVKKTLLTGGTPELRAKGRAAWRDLRAETVNRILEDARNVTSADETERAILTEAALRRSINRIPRENLEELLGKANTRELFNILRARRITTRSPVGGRTTQSGTIPNALTLMEKALKHVPGVKYAVGAKHAIKELGARGTAVREAKEATISPLEQAARDVERMSARRARAAAYQTLEQSGPTLPAGAPPQPLPIGAALNNQKKPPP